MVHISHMMCSLTQQDLVDRTCICASGRMAAAVQYYKSDDVVYTISKVSLWSLAEMTCTFLVFCAPSIPSTLSGLGLTKLPSIMKPFTWRPRSGFSRYQRPNWPRSNRERLNTGDIYQQGSHNGIPLRSFPARGTASESTQNLQDV